MGPENRRLFTKVNMPVLNSARRTVLQYRGPDVSGREITELDIQGLPDYRRKHLLFGFGKEQLGIIERPLKIPRTATVRLKYDELGRPYLPEEKHTLHLNAMAIESIQNPVKLETIAAVVSVRHAAKCNLTLLNKMPKEPEIILRLAILPGQESMSDCYLPPEVDSNDTKDENQNCLETVLDQDAVAADNDFDDPLVENVRLIHQVAAQSVFQSNGDQVQSFEIERPENLEDIMEIIIVDEETKNASEKSDDQHGQSMTVTMEYVSTADPTEEELQNANINKVPPELSVPGPSSAGSNLLTSADVAEGANHVLAVTTNEMLAAQMLNERNVSGLKGNQPVPPQNNLFNDLNHTNPALFGLPAGTTPQAAVQAVNQASAASGTHSADDEPSNYEYETVTPACQE